MPEYPFCSRSQSICRGTTPFSIWKAVHMSVKSWNSRHMLTTLKKGDIRLNENGKIVLTHFASGCYEVGPFFTCIYGPKSPVFFRNMSNKEPLTSQINTWCSSLTSQMDNLCNAYDAIKHMICWNPKFWPCYSIQPYAPGSVLTSRGRTLVGRVPTRLDEWVMHWPRRAMLTRMTGAERPELIYNFESVQFPLIVYLLADCSLAMVQ